MHIAITLEHLSARVGGAEGYALTVVRELTARGHRLTVCAADGEAPDGVEAHFGPLSAAPARLAALAPDLVVDWGLSVPADLHRLGGGTHREFQRLVLDAKPLAVRLLKRLFYSVAPRHRRVARREAALLSRPGVHVLAVSRFVATQVMNTVPRLPPGRLHVLHNGVDTRRFSPAACATVRAAERERLGLREDDVAFLLVAHNLKLKGFDLLAEVFSASQEHAPRARLVLLGRHNPGLRAPWFIYAGSSTEPEATYGAADVLLHPTYYDACANVVLEALACGLPVVSSDRNGSAEVLSTGKDGIVLPVVGPSPEISQRWSTAIGDLASQPALRAQLGQGARRRAEALTISAYVDRFEELLRRVAEERRQPR